MIETSQFALLELIKASLFGIEPHIPADTDWDAVYREAEAQTVVALAFPAVPQEAAEPWREAAAQSTAHCLRALFEQSELVKLFSENHIPLVILKGAAAAVYYPKPHLRTTGDVDFLVREADAPAARALLEGNGYAFLGQDEDGREAVYQKGGVLLELHRRFGDAGSALEPILARGMENADTRTLGGYDFPTLPDMENGLVLLDHIRHHLNGGLGIRQFADWAAFANACLSGEAYRTRFLPLLKEAGLVRFCEVVTRTCRLYFGLPDTLTWCGGADDGTATELLETVLRSGNFGRKTRYEDNPVREVASEMKRSGFFKTLQAAGVTHFPICGRNRFFRCFAWLFQLFRYACRMTAMLRRGEDVRRDMKDGARKADFYKRLGL